MWRKYKYWIKEWLHGDICNITLENTKGAIKNGQFRETDNIEYTRRRQQINTTQYVLDTTVRKQTQITSIRHEPSYKQLDIIVSAPYKQLEA